MMSRTLCRGPFWIFFLLSVPFPCQMAAGQTVVFEIDGAKKQPISPYIYGTNQPDWQGHSKYLTLTRWGGNRITAYNWETNASNAGSDWQHQNDDFLSKSDRAGGAGPQAGGRCPRGRRRRRGDGSDGGLRGRRQGGRR